MLSGSVIVHYSSIKDPLNSRFIDTSVGYILS